MPYTKTLWKDHKIPAINAVHLNKIELGIFNATNLTLLNKQGLIDIGKTITANKAIASSGHSSNASSIASNTTAIGKNKANQSLLTKGFHPQGNFTPQASLEYPANVTSQGFSYTIFMPNNTDSYTFTTGNLSGKSIHSGDHMYYTTASPHWHILKHNYVHKATDVDVKAGTNNDRYVTPKELKDNYATPSHLTNYLPLTGGTLSGQLNLDTNTPAIVFKQGAVNKASLRYYKGKTELVSYVSNSGIKMLDDGNIEIAPKVNKTLTVYSDIILKNNTQGNGIKISGNSSLGSFISGLDATNGVIRFNKDGDIKITPKSGKILSYKGKEVAIVDDLLGYASSADLSKYLPLSGGTMTGTLNMKGTSGGKIRLYTADGASFSELTHLKDKSLQVDGKEIAIKSDEGTIISKVVGDKSMITGFVGANPRMSISISTDGKALLLNNIAANKILALHNDGTISYGGKALKFV